MLNTSAKKCESKKSWLINFYLINYPKANLHHKFLNSNNPNNISPWTRTKNSQYLEGRPISKRPIRSHRNNKLNSKKNNRLVLITNLTLTKINIATQRVTFPTNIRIDKKHPKHVMILVLELLHNLSINNNISLSNAYTVGIRFPMSSLTSTR